MRHPNWSRSRTVKISAGDQSWHRIAGLAINDSDWGAKPGPTWYPRPDEDELVVGSALWCGFARECPVTRKLSEVREWRLLSGLGQIVLR